MRVEEIGNFLICRFDDAEIEYTAKYWTPERLANAQPAFATVQARPGHAVKTEEASRADLSVLPYKKAGRISYSKFSGEYYGSAQFVGSDNIILTAGHCLFDIEAKEFHHCFYFERGFKNDSCAKTFGIKAMAIRTEYSKATSVTAEYDYGFLITTSNSDVGYLNYSEDLPSAGTSFGYPGNYDNGKVMQTVDCSIVESTIELSAEMPGNPFGKGCSGGGWTDAAHNIIGLNACSPTSEEPGEEKEYSPLIDEKFVEIYEYVLKESLK